jgi:uncharacterized protein (DUF362 family)
LTAVVAEFERYLADLQARRAGQPAAELLELCLLALEREAIVSVAYRDEIVRHRLERSRLPEDVREIVRHALLWAWKDEEMHTVYVRGALLKLGSLRLKAAALVRQLAGGLGGWAASIRQHVRLREAPVARTTATVLTWAGILGGRIPKDVRRHLEYAPLRDFCLFNVDAEVTAARCWGRMAELAPGVPALAHLAREFARVKEDEDEHARMFEILADALDEDDGLRPGETRETLVRKIAAVSPFFLPRADRGRTTAGPLGSGGRVCVAEGTPADDKRSVLKGLLETADLRAALAARAAELGKPVADLVVAIKPTFMMAYHRDDPSTFTDPALLDELAAELRRLGCRDVAAIESPNIYDHFFSGRSVAEVARYLGCASPHYRLVDASADQVPYDYERGMAMHGISRTWKDADFRISFAKLRSHPVELVYLTVGNVEWLGERCDHFLFFERQAQRETAIMMLLDAFPPHFALVEGYEAAGDGLMGVMGCRKPRATRRIYAGLDALAVDTVAARHLGMRHTRESSVLRAAEDWFGGGAPIEVVGVDRPVAGWRGPYHDEFSAFLSLMAYPVYVLGSGRGALFVPEMDEKAFPFKEPESAGLRFTRSALRRFLGLRKPAA